MRILAITNLYPRPAHDTLAPFNRQQFDALAASNDLAVLAPVAWTDEIRDWKAGHQVPGPYRTNHGIEVRHPRYYFPPRILRSSYGRCFLASIRSEFHRLFRDFRPDVILGCWAHPDGWAAVQLAREVGLPVVIKVVGSDVLVLSGRSRRARMIEGLRHADAVVAVSRDLANRVVSFGVQQERVNVVYNGLDTTRFHPSDQAEARHKLGLQPGSSIVLFVGNLLLSKGAGVLLDAIALLAARGLKPTCIYVGRGRDERHLRSKIKKLKLEQNVILVGPKAHGDLPDWYHAADLVALPSYSEGIPNVLLEAAACGKPFVATQIGGIPEIAGETYCRLVAPGDPVAVAEAIEEVLRWGPIDPLIVNSWAVSASQLTDVLQATIHHKARSMVPSC